MMLITTIFLFLHEMHTLDNVVLVPQGSVPFFIGFFPAYSRNIWIFSALQIGFLDEQSLGMSKEIGGVEGAKSPYSQTSCYELFGHAGLFNAPNEITANYTPSISFYDN
ncbi:hypothetical protein ACJX0J_025920 [Zea mays]